jgi:hypothetical protein
MAVSEGFEPPTPRFEVWCSIRLSYETGSATKPRHRPAGKAPSEAPRGNGKRPIV